MLLGVIADDFTGATDIAGALAEGGMRVVLTIGVPADGALPAGIADCDAVVVATKSRALPPGEAVAQARAALAWLRDAGARRFYFKYCSTFDSTADGNIGPVADALLDTLQSGQTIICPAYPATGRTVYQGTLFVGAQPLAESPLKDHPLNPMRDSNLLRLLAAQSARGVTLIDWQTVSAGVDAVRAALAAAAASGAAYAVVDAIADNDLAVLAEASDSLPLLTGGAGLAQALPQVYLASGGMRRRHAPALPRVEGGAMILSGSCSAMTQRQLDRAKQRHPSFQLSPEAIDDGRQTVAEVLDWARRQPAAETPIIYATASAATVAATQRRYGQHAAGLMMERMLGDVAKAAVEDGARALIVAGGETSGAVVSALNIRALRLSAEIAPGVPWTESAPTDETPALALALKSGNFGGDDFFDDALAMLQ